MQEQQHAEVQTDGGGSHGHVLVAEVAGDSTHVSNMSVSVQEHQHEGGQQDRGEEHVLLDSGAGDRVQEEHVLVAGGAGNCAHVTNISASELEHQLTGVA